MDTIMNVLNGYLTAGLTGFAYALGVAIACKALKWAPVNITVNLSTTPERTKHEQGQAH